MSTSHSICQNLSNYKLPSNWTNGSKIQRSLWICIFKPLVGSPFPGSLWRKFILKLFGSRIGHIGRIKPGLIVAFPWNLVIGDHCWIGENVWIDNIADVRIGSEVCISQGVYLCTGNHNFRSPNFNLLLGSISIEDQVWIGAKSIIAPNVTIGFGAVVSLGSVVTSSIPKRAIVKPSISSDFGIR